MVLVSRLTYFHYFLFQLVTVARSFITNFGTVIINGSHRIAQELGNLHTVGNSQTDKGEDTQFGTLSFVDLGVNLLPFGKQGVEVFYKSGKQLQEGIIKIGIKFFQFLFYKLGRFDIFV